MADESLKGGELIIYVTYITAIRKTASDIARLQLIFDNHKIPYTKIDLGVNPEKREDMVKRSGQKTLPQVFIDETYIGGLDEIEDWNENECLLEALRQAGFTGEVPSKK